MNAFTREEEACFKTALALVVVRNRLAQQQQQQQQQQRKTNATSSNNSVTSNSKRRLGTASLTTVNNNNNDGAGGSRNRENEDMTTANNNNHKRIRTMESLMFPWTAAASSMSANHTNTNTNNSLASLAPRLQQSQKNHIQTIMVKAIRTALQLVTASQHDADHSNNHNNNETRDEHKDSHYTAHLWTTLEALTSHLGYQLYLSVSLSNKVDTHDTRKKAPPSKDATVVTTTTTTTNPTTTTTATKLKKKTQRLRQTATTPTLPRDWIQTWIRHELQQLLIMTDNHDNSTNGKTIIPRGNRNNNGDDSSRMMEASFLVWHGILLGGYHHNGPSANSRPSDTTTGTTTITPRHQLAACRTLFVQAFCDILQDILLPEHGANALLSSSDLSGSNANNRRGSLLGAAKKASTRTTNHPALQSCLRLAPPRPRQAWQRLFSVAHRYERHNTSPSVRLERMRQQHLVDLWVVHGLQLLHKVRDDDDDESAKDVGSGKSSSSSAYPPGRPTMLHRPRTTTSIKTTNTTRTTMMHPKMFLPPTDLVTWYIETVDSQNQQPTGTTTTEQQHQQDFVTTPTALDPGAKLMSMIALYQAVGK